MQRPLHEGPRVRVSVIVRVEEGHAGLLPGCLEAVLAQALDGPFEVVVVGGVPSAGAREFLTRARVRLLPGGGVGLGDALNRGIAAAEGELVVFVSAGSRPPPGWLAGLVARLDADPALAAVVSGEPGGRVERAVYRRRVLLEGMGLDPSLPEGVEVDLLLRVLEAGGKVAFETGPVGRLSARDAVAEMRALHRCALRAASRWRRGEPVALELVWPRVGPAAARVAVAGGLVAGLLGARRVGAVALAGACVRGALGAGRARRDAGLPLSRVPARTVAGVVREIAWGVGGLVGLARVLVAPPPAPSPRERPFRVVLVPVRESRSRWALVPAARRGRGARGLA